jgi:hypothetical protein
LHNNVNVVTCHIAMSWSMKDGKYNSDLRIILLSDVIYCTSTVCDGRMTTKSPKEAFLRPHSRCPLMNDCIKATELYV